MSGTLNDASVAIVRNFPALNICVAVLSPAVDPSMVPFRETIKTIVAWNKVAIYKEKT